LRFGAGAEKWSFIQICKQHRTHRRNPFQTLAVAGSQQDKIIAVTVAIVVMAGIYYFMASQREENEIAAGSALTQLLMTAPSPTVNPADALAKLAEKYPGTAAAQRAQLAAAASMFGASKYPEAVAAFQKFIDANPSGMLTATALLGLAPARKPE